ncbi:hemogen isoform X2 [Rhinatrema bivittatum]|uniref:hemogen isoform X2 n=1 Tax=Rhinatrema bivittatum TaxID=194408 RepID=UPI00112D5BA5|nr:hemogen isoform X2 [Rhinatrema bivittatum]
MADFEQDHPYSDFAQHPTAAGVEEHQAPVVTTRLRDRELLKKRKADAQEKETSQDQNRNKRQKKGRGTGRGRGKRSTKEPEAEVQPEEIPEAKGENGQVHLEYEEEPAVTVPEETSAGTQYETVEDAPQESTALHAEVSERDPESEKPDVLSLPLDSEQAEDDYYIPLL